MGTPSDIGLAYYNSIDINKVNPIIWLKRVWRSVNSITWIQVTIPAASAYGARGFPGLVPPNSALVFDLELITFN